MTLEELKLEAEKLGYSVVKKQQYIKLSPCTCGQKKPRLWYRFGGGEFFRCPNCDFEAPAAKTKKQARLNWNKSVETLTTQN
jgi:hypothetical protein